MAESVAGQLKRRDTIKLFGGAAVAAAGLTAAGGVALAAAPASSSGASAVAAPTPYTGPGNPLISLKTANPKNPATMFSSTVVYSVVSRGTGLGVGTNNNEDDCSYLFAQVKGDATFTCLVNHVGSTKSDNGNSSAGIMARSSLAPNASNVAVLATDGNGVVFKWRLHDNDPTEAWPMSIAIGVSAPIWVQLQRKGYNWTVQYSQDGTTWYNPTSTAVILPETYYVGLCATDYLTTLKMVDQFSHVSGFTPNSFISIMPPSSTSSSGSS